MEARSIPTGVKVLKWYFIIVGIFLCGAGLYLAVTETPGKPYDTVIIELLVYFLLGVCYGLFHILIGVHLSKGYRWARIVAIVLGILYLVWLPVGTALGILCLVFLLGKEGKAYFMT